MWHTAQCWVGPLAKGITCKVAHGLMAMQLSTVQGPSADEDTALYSGTSEETAFCDQELCPRTKKERQAGA